MNRRPALVLAVLLLTACSTSAPSAPTPAASSSTPSAAPTLGAVSGVDDLQAAYVDAGGTCTGTLEDRNVVKIAVASGACPGSGSVLSTYVTHDAAAESVEITTSIGRTEKTLILGENWVINPSGGDKVKADALAAALGGQVIRKEATPVTSLDDAMTLEQAAEAYSHVDGARCTAPVPEQDGSMLRCEDTAVVFDLGGVQAETPAQRKAAADEIQAGITVPGDVIVGRRHMLLVPESMDAGAVARQLDAAAPAGR